jgi:hypothetical protein
MPFVQGLLRQEKLSVQIDTICHHCDRPIQLNISSEPEIRVLESGAEPIVTLPMVNVGRLEDPSIIDAF